MEGETKKPDPDNTSTETATVSGTEPSAKPVASEGASPRMSRLEVKDAPETRATTGEAPPPAESADGKSATKSSESQKTIRPESRLNIQDLEEIEKHFLKEGEGYDNRLTLTRDQFCLALQTILKKGILEEYGELYDKIDVTKEGQVDWDKFASHMLLEFYEKDDRVKSTQVPQWKDLKHLPSPHKEVIERVSYLKNTNRYIAISREGNASMWGQNLKLQRTVKTSTDTCRGRDLWVTHFVPLQNINKIALAFTSKEIAFYDLSSKLEFNCQYKVQDLPFTPICLDYWSNPTNTNEAIITWGDTGGRVNAIHFNSASIALFERPPAPAGEKQETCLNVKLNHVKKGKYKNAHYVQHNAHTEWVRQVLYSYNLECFISCATTWDKALVIGWMEKHTTSREDMKTDGSVAPTPKTVVRSTPFAISQGVNAFDYHEKLNLIATAGVNHQVCLWNPYVKNKPNGVLRGHMASVVQVQFNKGRGQLISFSKDKVLRIWDVQLQVCIQRLAGMFPKGPEVISTLFFDEIRNKLFITFNYQLTVLEMKPEIKDRIMSHDKPIIAALYNSTYNQVVSVCQGGTVIVWMVDTGQKVKQFTNTHGNAEVTALAQDQSETRLFTGASDGSVKVWDFNGHCYHTLHCSGGQTADVGQILGLKRTVVVVGWAKYVTVFRTQAMRDFHVEASDWKGGQEHSDDILTAAFSSPNMLATGSYDGEIVIWNNNSEQASKKLTQRSRKQVGRRSTVFLTDTRENTMTSDFESERRSTAAAVHSEQDVRSRSRATSKMSLGSGEDGQDFGYTITCLRFLEARKCNSASGAANLVSCGGNGYVRFWNTNTAMLMAEFVAHPQVGSIIMSLDKTNHYMVTGDVDGCIKVWNISEYCRGSDPEGVIITTPPPLQAQWQPHQDSINSLEFSERNDRKLILTASSDCSMGLWDIYGNQIGIFGQEEHWKIDPYVHRFEDGSDDQEVYYDESYPASPCPSEVMEELETETQQVEFTDDTVWEPDERAVTDPADYRYNTWEDTYLGKNYQETRVQKRERKQPGFIPDLPYLHWERTGQPPAGPYAALKTASISTIGPLTRPDFVSNPDKYFPVSVALETSQLTNVGPLKKPDFVSHPNRYFGDREGNADGPSGPARVPHPAESLKTAFDEKTLFPRELLDFEAKMKSHHQVILREQQEIKEAKSRNPRTKEGKLKEKKAGIGLLKASGLVGPSPQGRSIASPATSKRGGMGGLRPFRLKPMGVRSGSVKESD